MEDSQIIRLFFQRSEAALAVLQDQFGGLCRSVISHVLTDPRDVEECISDTYLRIWNSIPPEAPARLSSYLARVARNAALDRHDYNTAQMRNSAMTLAYEELECYLPSNEESLDEKLFSQFINKFLRAQPKDARIYFIRRYWYGESIREIADACRCSEEKIKSSLFRTRNKLRSAMIEEEICL